MFLGSTQFQSRCMTQVELQYKSLTYEFTLFFFFPKKHYFTLVSKQLHHRPQKIQQLSLWPSHQSGHSPHLKYNTSIHSYSYNLVICTISIHNYNLQHLNTVGSRWGKQPSGCLVVPFRP